jgi:hypothetical protein
MKEQLLINFITLQEQFRVLHWQTKSFARHKAYGEIYGALNDLIDDFVEVYMGKYGRVEFTSGEGTIVLKNTNDLGLNEFLNQNLEFLMSLSNSLDPQKDSDLLNIRDEMMSQINKLKYLLTLK